MSIYKIPQDMKEFWGSETLNSKNEISLEVAVARVRNYTVSKGLCGEQEFRLDDMLKKALATDRNYMLFTEIGQTLAPYRVKDAVASRPATDTWCPAKNTENHMYGEGRIGGYSWHGPVYCANCIHCGYLFSDH